MRLETASPFSNRGHHNIHRRQPEPANDNSAGGFEIGKRTRKWVGSRNCSVDTAGRNPIVADMPDGDENAIYRNGYIVCVKDVQIVATRFDFDVDGGDCV